MGRSRACAAQAAIDAAVSIRVSPRARRVGLRIDAAERKVEVILPRGVAVKTGLRFLEAKRDWVAARLERCRSGAVRRGARGTGAGRGPPDPPRARPCRTAGQDRRRRDPGARRSGISGTPGARSPGRLAGAEIASRARRLAAQIGRDVARVTCATRQSRWGSCSGRAISPSAGG